jgi:serine protease Do
MRQRSLNLLPALLLGLTLLAPGAARAAAGDPGEAGGGAAPKKVVEKRVEGPRVVVVEGDDQEGNAGDEPGVRTQRRVIHLAGKGVPRGYLGVGLTDLTPELRTHFGVPEGSGVMVSKVEAGSPAEKAGFKVGDIITRAGDDGVDSSMDLGQQVRQGDDGVQLPFEVWRNGKVQTLTATLEKRDRQEIDMAPFFFKRKDGDHVMLLGDGDLAERRFEIPVDNDGGPGRGVRVERFKNREAELEKRLKELEKRIDDLQRQLEKKQK